jgi:LPXTG-motif cell wall-anchored protein
MRQRGSHARRTAAGLLSMVVGAVILVGAFPAGAGTAGGYHPTTSSSHEDTTTSVKETTSTTHEETTSTTHEETTSTTHEETTSTTAQETTTTKAPEESTTTAAGVTTTAPAPELPKTGSNSTWLMAGFGALLLVGGGALVAATRVLRRT